MKHDGLLDVCISILAGSVVVDELSIQVVEVELDLGSTRELSLASGVLALLISFCVKLTSNGVLINGHKVGDHVPEEMQLLGGLAREGRAEVSKSLFDVLGLVLDLLGDLRKVVLDVSEHDFSQLRRQNFCSKSASWHSRVNGVSSEVELFSLDGIPDRHVVNDVLLRSVLHTDVAESQRDILTSQHALGVGTFVHDIDLGQDTNGTETLGVELSGHLETVRG